VIINPSSGNGNAIKIWDECQEKFLDKAGYKFHKIISAYKNYCHDYIVDLPKEIMLKYTGIIICGGDGTVHEVVNGLLSRPDREDLLYLAIGIIPAGTNNGLISSILRDSFKNEKGFDVSEEKRMIEYAALIIAKQ